MSLLHLLILRNMCTVIVLCFYVLIFTITECTFIILEKSVFENMGDEIGKFIL